LTVSILTRPDPQADSRTGTVRKSCTAGLSSACGSLSISS